MTSRAPSRRIVLALAAAVVAAAAFGAWRWWSASGAQPQYKFGKIESGPIVATVAATGTLNPVVSVQVGSQISGQVREILVDFNSTVKQGQLVARIDPETYQLRVRQAEADLEATRAAVAVQRAEVARAAASLLDAQRDYERKKMLVEKKFISAAELDKAATTLDAAKAAADVAQAQVRNSEAVVRQRESQLAQARVDLERTAIRSPVDGVVVKRSVDSGQTVAASLQAPELFVIARNLSDMQVEAAIDEADVGRIQVGQKATFTVDAFPGRGFEGAVTQVRKAAKVESNVVSYTVVISAANPDLSLLPGMTANVRIVTAQKDKVLKAPNATLRFRPPSNGDDKPAGGGMKPRGRDAGGGGRVWVLGGDGKPKAIPVKLGLTDGSMTELLEGEVAEGMEVIVGTQTPAAKSAPTSGPRMF